MSDNRIPCDVCNDGSCMLCDDEGMVPVDYHVVEDDGMRDDDTFPYTVRELLEAGLKEGLPIIQSSEPNNDR